MKTLVVILCTLLTGILYGQAEETKIHKVEIYFLNKPFPDNDTKKSMIKRFSLTKDYLQLPAFIKAFEIISFSIDRDTVQLEGQTLVKEVYKLEIPLWVQERVQNLNKPLNSGKQFAVVLDKEILFDAFFWNMNSSSDPKKPSAWLNGNQIVILRKIKLG